MDGGSQQILSKISIFQLLNECLFIIAKVIFIDESILTEEIMPIRHLTVSHLS